MDFIRIVGAQDTAGQGMQAIQVGVEHHLLDREHIGRVHGELAQAHAQQQAGQAGVAGHFAAHRHRQAGLVGGLDGVLNQI